MTNINGKTKVLSLLAQNTDHSLSPLIHNFSANYLNIDAVYVPMPFKGNDIAGFLNFAKEIGLVGFNVTVPYKQLFASALGYEGLSINTVYMDNGDWKAVSTDPEGFCQGLKRMGKSINDFENIVFLGNGGAALAIAKYLYDVYDIKIYIHRRDKSRDAVFPSAVTFADFNLESLKTTLRHNPNTLLVQSTNAPLNGNNLEALSPAIEQLDGAFVDLVYKTPSDLFYVAERRGLPCIDGLPMLVEQAVLSQKYWWGRSVDSSVIYDYIEKCGV